MSIPQLIISVLLFIVMFFGIGFILNMLLRATWVMAIVYPLVVIFIVDEVKIGEYFTNFGTSFSELGTKLIGLSTVDVIVLLSGLTGAILSGVAIKVLRKRGYQMF